MTEEKRKEQEQQEQYQKDLENQKWEAMGSLNNVIDAWMVETAYQITKNPYRKSKGRRRF